jgi:hypothetical protein
MSINGRVIAALIGLALVAMLPGCGGDSDNNNVGIGVIAFTTTTMAGLDMNIMNGDGSNQRLLLADASQGALSNDGVMLAFVRGNNLFVENKDGTNLAQLTNNAEGTTVSDPGFNPINTQVIYASRTGMNTPDIHIVNTDGTNDHVVVTGADDPAFSPTGHQIAYVQGADIFTASPDGSDPVNMTNNGAGVLSSDPAYNPIGNQIAFEQATTNSMTTSVRIMSATKPGPSTEVIADADDPSFNPAGDRIAFERAGQIFTTRLDGSGLNTLTMGPNDSDPSWAL